jgi:hypothetical protein
VNLVGLPIADRPAFFASLAPRLQELRARCGRPHWLLIDEAHHLLPAEWEPGPLSLPEQLKGVMQISVHPDLIAPKALCDVRTLIVVGKNPDAAFRELGRACNVPIPTLGASDLEPGQALVWHVAAGTQPPVPISIAPSFTERRRHTRKYAEGELPPDRSFYFRGPERKLNLRARNLIQFLQLAEGLDDDTWMHHLRNGHYSEWVQNSIKDDSLAESIRGVEQDRQLSAAESRERVKEAVEAQYTLPATASPPDSPKASAREGSSRKPPSP